MRRVLFHWRGFDVYSYPALMYAGLVTGIVVENYAARVDRLDSPRVFVATLILLVPALIGARLLFVGSHWRIYRRDLKRIWRRSEGGSAMYGGLPLAVLASVPLLFVLHVPFGAFWDVACVTILVSMVFARFGCLLHGCCAGRPTQSRFGLWLADCHGRWERRLPTQLFEAGLAILLLIGLIAFWKDRPFAGALFLYVVAGYGVGRFVLEATRDDIERVQDLPVQRVISVALVGLALTLLLISWPR